MQPGPASSAVTACAADGATAGDALYKRQVPAWMLSFGLHLAGLITIAMIVPRIPQGAAQEAVRTGGIVLVSRAPGPPQYLSEDDAGGDLTDIASNAAGTPTLGDETSQSNAPETANDLAGLLPKSSDSLAGSTSIGNGGEQANRFTQGAGPSKGLGHNYAQTGVFGVKGEGTKFVYVFDRSGSMDGYSGRPLAAAKRELLASLQDLGPVHQFQIIFYNERPTILNPSRGAQARMLYGNESDKKIAQDFVRGILADGGTRHVEALEMALRMKPDVIFFLTDADEPTLSHAELERIRKLNDRVGCSINAIEFGGGPRQSRESFLMILARENSGHHAYVDLTKLPAK